LLRRLYVQLIKIEELFERRGRAVIVEGVAQAAVRVEIGEVQEIADVAALQEQLDLLGEHLCAAVAHRSRDLVQRCLHGFGWHPFLGEQEQVRAARFGAAHHKRQLQLADALDQPFVVQRVLVDVDTAPLAIVGLVDGDDADTRPLARQVPLPKSRGPRFLDDGRLPDVLSIRLLAINAIGAVGQLEPIEDRCKSFCVRHSLPLLLVRAPRCAEPGDRPRGWVRRALRPRRSCRRLRCRCLRHASASPAHRRG
jgi:hypothetical protein